MLLAKKHNQSSFTHYVSERMVEMNNLALSPHKAMLKAKRNLVWLLLDEYNKCEVWISVVQHNDDSMAKSLVAEWLEQASQWHENVLSWSGGHKFEPQLGRT